MFIFQKVISESNFTNFVSRKSYFRVTSNTRNFKKCICKDYICFSHCDLYVWELCNYLPVWPIPVNNVVCFTNAVYYPTMTNTFINTTMTRIIWR